MFKVDLAGIQMDPNTGAAVLVLREHDAPNRLLPISVGGPEAASIAIAASGQAVPRPMTHDLMATLIEGFDGHLDAVEVTDLQDGSFLASLAISGPGGERRFDTRPSDGIALAVRLRAPLYVSEHVLEEAGSLPTVELDEVAIEAEVDQFRSFLAELEPGDFQDETALDADQVSNSDATATATDTDQTSDPEAIDSEPDVIDSEFDVTDREFDVTDRESDATETATDTDQNSDATDTGAANNEPDVTSNELDDHSEPED